MNTRKLEIPNKEGEVLVCVEVTPSNLDDIKVPVVVFAHGFGYFKEEDGLFTEEAKRLAENGFACYYFDFSGCGESEGNYEHTSLTKLAEDLKSVYEYVKSLDYTDDSDISFIGHSFGTNVINAAQITDASRIVLGGAPFYPYESIKNLFPDFNEHGVSHRMSTSERTRTMGPQFWKDLKEYSPEELIKNFDCPMLFIHGEKDTIVPIENMDGLSKNAKNPKRLVLEQGDHGFKPERERVFRAIVELFST